MIGKISVGETSGLRIAQSGKRTSRKCMSVISPWRSLNRELSGWSVVLQ